jgi:hypothetical protein
MVEVWEDLNAALPRRQDYPKANPPKYFCRGLRQGLLQFRADKTTLP